jgi:hypothetical protein
MVCELFILLKTMVAKDDLLILSVLLSSSPLANEYVDDVTIPTQVIQYNQNFLQADQPIIFQYSNQIKLFGCIIIKQYA